jgi:hypothetical protein
VKKGGTHDKVEHRGNMVEPGWNMLAQL